MKYPCDHCTWTEDPGNCLDKRCTKWQAWFLEAWQSFNNYYAAECKKMAKRAKKKMNRYPSPCLTCQRQDRSGNCGEYKRCDRYRSWIRWNWLQFNRYYQMEQRAVRAMDGIYPCTGCVYEKGCDKPCKAYRIWFPLRMKQIRRIWHV